MGVWKPGVTPIRSLPKGGATILDAPFAPLALLQESARICLDKFGMAHVASSTNQYEWQAELKFCILGSGILTRHGHVSTK